MKGLLTLVLAVGVCVASSSAAQNLRSEGVPGLVVGTVGETKPLRPDEQYYVEVACTERGHSEHSFLRRTNKFGRFTQRTPNIHARHAAHFAIVSNSRIRRFTSSTTVAEIVANPNTAWSEIFLLSDGPSSSTFTGGCLDSFFIAGKSSFYAGGFLGVDTKGASTAAISGFLTFLISLKETVENVSLADLSASESSNELVDAKAIVEAYRTFEASLARSRADFKAHPLQEGLTVIQTGFSQISLKVTRYDTYLFADDVPFRANARRLLNAAVKGTDVSPEFASNLKKSLRDLVALDDPDGEIQGECRAISGKLIEQGYYSDIDRAYLLGILMARQKARAFQRVMCFKGADLVDVMLENSSFRELLAHRSKGGGRGAVFYTDDYQKAAILFGWQT